jgi:hypothetical protein
MWNIPQGSSRSRLGIYSTVKIQLGHWRGFKRQDLAFEMRLVALMDRAFAEANIIHGGCKTLVIEGLCAIRRTANL